MKKFFGWMLGVLIVVLLLGVAGYVIALFKAKDLIATQIQQQLHRESFVGSIGVRFPLRLVITDFKVFEAAPRQQELFLAAREISVMPSVTSLLAGRVVLHEVVLTEPSVTLERLPGGQLNCSDLLPASAIQPTAGGEAGQPSSSLPPAIRLVVQRGTIRWIDRAVVGDPVTIQLRDLSLRVAAAPRGLSAVKIDASLDARIESVGAPGRLSGRGWYEYPDRNLEAQVRLSGLDIATALPYLGAQASRLVQQGILDAGVSATAERNQLKARCELRGHEVALVSGATSGGDFFSSMLSGMASGGEVALDLDVTGQLDQPQTWQMQLSGDFMRKALEQAVMTGLDQASKKEGADGTAGNAGQGSSESTPDAVDRIRKQLEGILQ